MSDKDLWKDDFISGSGYLSEFNMEMAVKLIECRRSEKRFRDFITASYDVVYRMNPDWSEMFQLQGRNFIPDTDIPNCTWLDKYIHPDDRQQVLKVINKSIQAKSIFELEHRVRKVDGTLGWTFSRAVPMMDDNGDIMEWVGAATDITSLKQAEAALHKSEEKYRSLFENMNEGYSLCKIIYDGKGQPSDFCYTEINKAYEEQTGLKAVDIIGKTLLEVAPDIEPTWINMFKKVSRTGEPSQLEGYNISTKKYYETSVFSHQKGYIATLIKDISKRREIEERLHDNEEKFRTVIENSRDGINMLDLETGRYILMSPSQVGLTGFTIEEINNISAEEAYERVHPDDREISVAQQKLVAEGLDNDSTVEYRWKVKSGEYRWFSDKQKLVRNKDGQPVALVGVSRDITDRKEEIAERERFLNEKNKALKDAIRMKDEFLASITHEFKTPLTVINAALQTIESLYGSQLFVGIKKHLKTIQINSYRQLRLVKNLLDIARYNTNKHKANKQNVDIVFLTKAIIKSVEPYANQKGVVLKFQTDSECIIMAIDEEGYERILLNLLSNAIKFTPEGNSIFVQVYRENEKAKIAVIDKGIGIPKGKQKLIFERFGQVSNSLSRQAEGSGIGLSLVKSLVNSMNGTITVDSKIKKGSTFTVKLPITKIKSRKSENNTIDLDKRIIQATAIEFSNIYLE